MEDAGDWDLLEVNLPETQRPSDENDCAHAAQHDHSRSAGGHSGANYCVLEVPHLRPCHFWLLFYCLFSSRY